MAPMTLVVPWTYRFHLPALILRLLGLAGWALACGLAAALPLAAGDEPTGLRDQTPEDAAWMQANFPPVQRIRPNRLAFDRVNAERQARGQAPLNPAAFVLAPQGDEVDFTGTGGAAPTGGDITGGALTPAKVDNSLLPAFPAIGHQKVGSCVAWASTYYCYTYETALVNGWDAKNIGSNRFSTKWVYNMINGGVDNGSNFGNAFNLLIKHGAPRFTEFPEDTNYLAWDLNSDQWRTASAYKLASTATIYDANPDNEIALIKQQLANGHLVVYGTYVNSWDKQTVKDDPADAADNAFVGQAVARYMHNNRNGGHAMTVVGYDDSLWCDVNLNGVVDAGEKGAFKVANSWGTADWNLGFRWVAYDALRDTSAVTGAPTDREGIFTHNGYPSTFTVKGTYTPKLLAKFTVNHLKRGQLRVRLGLDATTKTTPAATWTPAAINLQGGNWAFDGTATAIDGTFVFDFTDLNPPTGSAKRYFLGVYDSTTGDPATVSSFQLVDAGGTVLATAANTPKTADAAESWVYIDYTLPGLNAAPTVATAAAAIPNPVTGTTTTVTVTGADDGGAANLVYTWSATGPAAVSFNPNGTNAAKTVTATFSRAGAYEITATIADVKNFTVTSSVYVTVNQTLTTVTVAPTSVALSAGGTQAFTVTQKDQFARAMSPALPVAWTATGGTITAAGLYTAGALSGTYNATATVAGVAGSATVTIAGTANAAPTVATAAAATPNPVTAAGTALSVLGADDGGEAALTYTWSASGPAAVSYSANGNNAAKSTTANFTKAGTYVFTATIRDAGALTVTSTVTVTVNQTLTTVTVSPASAAVAVGGTQSFSVAAKDQFGNSQTATFTWSVSGGGTITSSGLFTAGNTAGGPYTVTATSGAKSGTATVTVTPPANLAPTIVSPATATPNPVVNQSTTSLFVAASDADSGPSALTYTWAKVSGPGTVTFSPNGTTVSDASTATFSASGTYTLQVTVSDGAASVTSQITALSVTLPSAPTITTQPVSLTVTAGSTATFSVSAAGTAPLTYQWKFGTTNVGTNSNTLAIVNAQSADAGNYKVVISNSAGSVTSVTVSLTVNPAPTAPSITTQPADVTVMAGQPATFSVAATGTGPLHYQWRYGTKNVGTDSPSYTLSAVRTRDQGGYSVVVSNAYGSVTSVTAQLTVTKAIRVTNATLAFSGGGSALPPPETMTLSNDSIDPVDVTVGSNQVWLGVTPGSTVTLAGGSSASFTVTADSTGVSGTVSGQIDIADSASQASQAVPVSLTVSAGSPTSAKRAGCALGGGGDDSALWLLLLTAIATLCLSVRGQKVAERLDGGRNQRALRPTAANARAKKS